MENRHQGQGDINMMGGYCLLLQKEQKMEVISERSIEETLRRKQGKKYK